jgi:hypothetical protein
LGWPPQAANPHGFCKNSPAINRRAGQRVESARLIGEICGLISSRLQNLLFLNIYRPSVMPRTLGWPPQAANPHGFCKNSPAIDRRAAQQVESAR